MKMKNKLKEVIDFIGYSYKKVILIFALLNIAFLGLATFLFLFFNNIIYALITIVLLFAIDYLFVSHFFDKKAEILKNRENELIDIISYFEVYIQNNNNVYQSFKMLIPYCSEWMKEKVEKLLNDIDKDKSVQPYIDFANCFTQLAAHSLMLSIYQMVDQGENSKQLLQFTIIFEELAKNRAHEIVENKEKSLTSMSAYPLIGAGFITVTLTISIISILGDLINVI